MKKVLIFSFVSHYYNNFHEFIGRIIEFVKDYYEGIIYNLPEKRSNFLITKIQDTLDVEEVFFGEVVPKFYQTQILEFSMNDFTLESELLEEMIKEISLKLDNLKETKECINVKFLHYVK